jgi:hypothetical protein
MKIIFSENNYRISAVCSSDEGAPNSGLKVVRNIYTFPQQLPAQHGGNES